jgi:hypothetical protein
MKSGRRPAAWISRFASFLSRTDAAGERNTLNHLVCEICRVTGRRVEPSYGRGPVPVM